MKYLLSNGFSTDRVEYYIIDLFKLYLNVYPGDVPGLREFGFDFNMSGVMKSELIDEVRGRVQRLISLISDRFNGGIRIELSSCDIIDETKAKVVVNVGRISSEDIEINLSV